MKLLRTTCGYIYGRPFILWFPALIILLVCIVDIYNPLSSLLFGLSSLTGGNITDSIISMIQILVDPAYLPLAAGAAVIFVIAASLAGGLLFSGYFYVLHNAVEGIPKSKGEFFDGVRKFFFKVTGVNFGVLLLGVVLAVFLLISSVPAAVVGRMAMSGKGEFFIPAVFIAVLTVIVVFFIIMFYRSYMFFLYPSVLSQAAKPFKEVRVIVDRIFWRVVGRLLVFDIFWAASLFMISYKSSSVLLFIVDWLFKTFYCILLAVYVFGSYSNNRRAAFNQE